MTRASDQSAFALALLDRARPPPTGLVSWNGSDPAQRFAVYRNNVMVSLIDALAAKFPVACQLVGAEFFRAMVRRFAAEHPPSSPIMAEYGELFPDFIAGFPPAQAVPYLADVATLEAARVRAYHAMDADSFGREEFASIDPATLDDLTFCLHPSAAIVQSRFAIVALWDAHQGRRDIGSVDPFHPEDALIVRPDMTVEVTSLPPGVAVFLECLRRGDNLGDAAQATMDAIPAFLLADAFNILVATGVVIAGTSANGESE